ncbi:hypothetical protein PN836_001095 [Ningiella sp. W23]|uniref:hypothetical protein n=1 Tax=Ningiella sp. W23 TaxID=3023715 RepID=UPI003757602D
MIDHGRVQGVIVSDGLIPSEIYASHPNWKTIHIAQEELFHYLHRDNEVLVAALTIRLNRLLLEKKAEDNDMYVNDK